ncbi:MAG: RNA polymerase sigma factor RpoD/SigA [Prevotellaceae bacterium]|nr:RNA polymerase sigma factor RpoD/SigA [Prevotellaceae bacterium]
MRQLKITQSTTSRDEQSISDYLAEISKIPQLTTDEEVELARKIQSGGPDSKDAIEKLVNGNLRFVVSVAKQYQGMGLPLGDIISEGNIGLIRAAERFDETRGFKFISYAVWWIRQSIMTAISEQGRMVRLPQNNVLTLNRYWKMCDEYMQQYQRKPTIEEFAEAFDMDINKATAIVQAAAKYQSLDAPMSEDSENSAADLMPSENKTDEAVDKESLVSELLLVMQTVLKQREFDIVRKSFGIACPQVSIEELSSREGLSRERLRQIRERSIAKLRECSSINMLRPFLG